MSIATLTVDGQITIPEKIRELLRLHPGDQVNFVVQGNNRVWVQPVRVELDDLFGSMHRPGQPVLSIEEIDQAIVGAVCASVEDNT
ncbi:MAG: AbrB/MazE/SpoVT family DNA-binding domain-containing protein [Magnetococcus sp. DMHC-1]|nr:AbrB/MazE/SpoVT family DNA-binding domain-containing protein [Magnetococcales bacterium]